MRKISHYDLESLTSAAIASPRKRAHRNLHASFNEPCQRLLIAIERDSYIAPHRHQFSTHPETLLAVRGEFSLIIFDNGGNITDVVPFGAGDDLVLGVEVAPYEWHTVVSMKAGSVLFETKSGPFVPELAKEFAPWAPREATGAVASYLEHLNAAAACDRSPRRCIES